MSFTKIGRNDPCPCGSGKKFKHCCLEKTAPGPADLGPAGPLEELQHALAGRRFDSMEELQALLDRQVQQRNRTALEGFHGLSPEQMHRLLHLPFSSPDVVLFPETLDTPPTAPLLSVFRLLADGIGERGLKPTAKGNLPRNLCREIALAYWGEQTYRENTEFAGINREEDFSDLHITRILAELAALIRKYKGRFILSRACRDLLAGGGMAAIYPRLFRAYVERFNWAYGDGYPELRIIQTAFAFTLYLLTRHGERWRPHEFYEDSFLRAFPAALDEVPLPSVFTPEEQVRRCYTWRTLVHFAGFLGLAAVEPVSKEPLCSEYRVKAMPLLRQVVPFRITG